MDPNARKYSQVEDTTLPDNCAREGLLLEAEDRSRSPSQMRDRFRLDARRPTPSLGEQVTVASGWGLAPTHRP